MELALRAGPDLVSPNVTEAEELVGHEFRDEQDHIYALYGLCELGAREAIITHEEGCYALVGRNHERSLFSVRADALEPVSAIGAGDVFLAGYLAARYTGRGFEECPAVCGCVRRGGDPALRRRRARAARGRADRGRGDRRRARGAGAGRRAGLAPALRQAPIALLTSASSWSPLTKTSGICSAGSGNSDVQCSSVLGCPDGARDRQGQEGSPRLRLRRHRDRALAADARSGRHRHHLDARALPVRASAARLGDGRRRLAQDGRHHRPARAASGCSTSRESGPATRMPMRSSSGSPTCRRPRPPAGCRRSTGSRSSPS